MVNNRATWRMKARGAALALTAAVAAMLAVSDGSAVHAQGIMRSPSFNIGPRITRINPNVGARVNPNIAGRVGTNVGISTPNTAAVSTSNTAAVRMSTMRVVPRIGVHATLPYLHTSPNLYPLCDDIGGDAACGYPPDSLTDGGGGGPRRARANGPRRDAAQVALNQRTVANEIVAEIDGSLSNAQADELARRHGLVRLESQNFPLIGGTIGLFRVTDRRPVETARRELSTEASVRSTQPNFRYILQDNLQAQKAALTEGDPAQYALPKLRLPEAHTLAHGANVIVAVIDSGIDVKHPELSGSIASSFDALGSKEGPHIHGTGIAGAIVAHARLMGGAPAARILAIRAFGVAQNRAESSSFVILKGLDYAASHGAQIINMSFAGPRDALIERGVAAVAAKGIVMVAAAGNAGAKSPPLYPAANENVIAVSATDNRDRLFAASNRGGYVAVAAPGVDIFLPAPDEKYQMTSGTSFSAAYVSGIAALLLERNPALKPDEVRAVLMKTARDLGAPGRDDLFGAGEADAYAAVMAAVAAPALPVATASDQQKAPEPQKTLDPQDVPATRALNQPAMASEKPASEKSASEKSASRDADHPAAER